MREVSRAHSTKRKPFARNPRLKEPYGKERIQCKPLDPNYVVGFIDGEGSFSVSINRHRSLKRGIEVKPEFEIELREDDKEILERIVATIGCGHIYDCSYERYGWRAHAKLKVTSTKDLETNLFPFLDRHPLQAKKRHVYELFRQIVLMCRSKLHLTDEGYEQILHLRNQMRLLGKKDNHDPQLDPALETARIRENRSSGGVDPQLTKRKPNTARQVKGVGNARTSP